MYEGPVRCVPIDENGYRTDRESVWMPVRLPIAWVICSVPTLAQPWIAYVSVIIPAKAATHLCACLFENALDSLEEAFERREDT